MTAAHEAVLLGAGIAAALLVLTLLVFVVAREVDEVRKDRRFRPLRERGRR